MNICFISARNLLTTAKLNLGIFGYASEEQQQALVQEAQRLFYSSPLTQQRSMQERNEILEHKVRQITDSHRVEDTEVEEGGGSWEKAFNASGRSTNSAVSVSSSYGLLFFGPGSPLRTKIRRLVPNRARINVDAQSC